MAQRRIDLKYLPQLLTLPGDGVFTVHTAQEKKNQLLQAYYQTTHPEKARQQWLKVLSKLETKLPWILGIPSDNGGGIQRGANWGPLAIREKILSHRDSFTDLGDIRVIPHLLHDKYLNPATIRQCRRALYGRDNSLPVSPLSIAERALGDIYRRYPDARILGLGGDHSTSYPLVLKWLESRPDKKKVALLHFDAHTDLLEKRLGIDLCFGTWTFHILKLLASKNHLLQVGIRSSGKTKRYWKNQLGVEQYWAHEVARWGVEKTVRKLKRHYHALGVSELYVSFDIDALDKKFAAATGTPEAGGLLPTDAAAIIMSLREDFKITGADLMEVAPFVLPDGFVKSDQHSSLITAADMARILLSALCP
jgi:agmatinase